ncbi:hypothetical protein [Enterococcus sp. S86.2]|uniref:hypothetical protein n=1 Tax=Enterococcus sp. S86.2 TaxID=3031299 RepID=UPI0026ED91C9|nr:hypothetical protein [Enterococcus sp. S86.2]
MHRNLLVALALPSIMFYQSSNPFLYSNDKLITQEEQEMLTFDLSETGNTLVISNDRLEEPVIEETYQQVELGQVTNQTRADSLIDDWIDEKADKNDLLDGAFLEREGEIPRTGRQTQLSLNKKKNHDALEMIERRISDLPFVEPHTNKNNASELARMLASMSGTILYGTKQQSNNWQEYITF